MGEFVRFSSNSLVLLLIIFCLIFFSHNFVVCDWSEVNYNNSTQLNRTLVAEVGNVLSIVVLVTGFDFKPYKPK